MPGSPNPYSGHRKPEIWFQDVPRLQLLPIPPRPPTRVGSGHELSRPLLALTGFGGLRDMFGRRASAASGCITPSGCITLWVLRFIDQLCLGDVPQPVSGRRAQDSDQFKPTRLSIPKLPATRFEAGCPFWDYLVISTWPLIHSNSEHNITTLWKQCPCKAAGHKWNAWNLAKGSFSVST